MYPTLPHPWDDDLHLPSSIANPKPSSKHKNPLAKRNWTRLLLHTNICFALLDPSSLYACPSLVSNVLSLYKVSNFLGLHFLRVPWIQRETWSFTFHVLLLRRGASEFASSQPSSIGHRFSPLSCLWAGETKPAKPRFCFVPQDAVFCPSLTRMIGLTCDDRFSGSFWGFYYRLGCSSPTSKADLGRIPKALRTTWQHGATCPYDYSIKKRWHKWSNVATKRFWIERDLLTAPYFIVLCASKLWKDFQAYL